MLPQTIGFLILSASWLCGLSYGETIEMCGDRSDMYISIEEDCSHYIFCYGDESFEGDCDPETPYFSEVDQTCDSDPNVCKTKAEIAEPPPNEPSVAEPPVFVDQPELPNLPLKPDDVGPPIIPEKPSVPSPVVTLPPAIISPSIPTVSAVATSSSTSLAPSSSKPTPVATAPPAILVNVATKCPAVDDPSKIVFLQHTKSCSDYFMCYHGEPLPMHCSDMLHFDITSLKCDYPENVKCQLESASPREKCQAHTVDVYPHPFNCNYYYFCRYGYLMVMQCPLNMDWDYKKRACVLRRKAECYASLELTRL